MVPLSTEAATRPAPDPRAAPRYYDLVRFVKGDLAFFMPAPLFFRDQPTLAWLVQLPVSHVRRGREFFRCRCPGKSSFFWNCFKCGQGPGDDPHQALKRRMLSEIVKKGKPSKGWKAEYVQADRPARKGGGA